jgi:nitrite reductase (NAD(P)H)
VLTKTSEKVIKQDTTRRYDILVIGEEPHIAYNRVGLSSYFEHRKIEDLYLNPKEWVSYCKRP